MADLLSDPVIQSSVAPFFAALIVAGAMLPLRLAGLAAAAGFLATVFLVGNFALSPLTATRKIVVLGTGAALIGVLAGLAFRPNRSTGLVLGAVFGSASIWVFWSVLVQKPVPEALVYGAGIAALVMWLVAFTVSLHADPVRAGAAGLALGLGSGVAAVLGASALIGQYGLGLGAACGAFLLLVMILGRRVAAGTVLTLTASVLGALLGAGALLLAQLPWTSLAALASIPVLVRLPLGASSPAWVQAIVASIYGLAGAGAACLFAWLASRSSAG